MTQDSKSSEIDESGGDGSTIHVKRPYEEHDDDSVSPKRQRISGLKVESEMTPKANIRTPDESSDDSETGESGAEGPIDLGRFKAQVVSIIRHKGNEYNPSDSEDPLLPGFRPESQSVRRECDKLIENAIGILKAAEHSDGKTAELAVQFHAYGLPELTPPRRIGMLGDSGFGKSSVVNSLLNLNLAHEADTGAALTAAPTEYHARPVFQESEYVAEVEFLSAEERVATIHECIEDFSDFYREDLTRMDAETRSEAEKKANTARDICMALFADHDEFKDKVSAQQFLMKLRSKRDQTVINRLLTWLDQTVQSLQNNNGFVEMEADDMDDLRELIAPYVLNLAANGKPLPWPLVKVVKYDSLDCIPPSV